MSLNVSRALTITYYTGKGIFPDGWSSTIGCRVLLSLDFSAFSETFVSSTIQVQTVEMMEGGREAILLLLFQPVFALTASPRIAQECNN